MGKSFDVIPPNVLEALCRALGEIPEGLSGADINKYLADCGINNPNPEMTKWKRLYNAFSHKQYNKRNSNDILKFVQVAIHPSRFVRFGSEYFISIIDSLNPSLSFIGLKYCNDGKFRSNNISRTIDDAQKRANTLYDKLKSREVHEAIYRYCKPELLQSNYFHAVFETTKGVAERIRGLSLLDTDGANLINEVFSSKTPILIVNNFTTETDVSEHRGFANLLIGFFGMFRNTTAHAPKVQWEMSEQDALEIMTIASLCHRKLDKAHKIR